MKYIQSYILNLAPVSSLDELYIHLCEDNTPGNIERLYLEAEFENPKVAEDWTAPRWAKAGDICFFMQSVTTLQRLRRLKNELQEVRKDLFQMAASKSQRNESLFLLDNETKEAKRYWYYRLEHAICEAEISYRAFGGKVFAIGKVSSTPVIEKKEAGSLNHWGTSIYCNYNDVHILEEPIPFPIFKNYVSFSQQSAITPVFGKSFDKIKELILKKNPKVASFFRDCVSSQIPMTKINKNNWLEVIGMHKFEFILEAAFRRYYTDYLLEELKDSRKVYSECPCLNNEQSGIIDNVILLGGKFLATEIKLNHKTEADLEGQLNKYYNPNRVCLKDGVEITGKDMHKAVLLIDTFSVYLYKRGRLNKVKDLNSIKTSKDIQSLKIKLCVLLSK